MDQNYTDITIILDRSGSMSSVKSDTIGGFNTFLDQQKQVEGKCQLTLVQFDNEYTPVYSQDIDNAPLLNENTFVPRGTTALLDAIGRTINETEHRIDLMDENERPTKVLMVIITDGLENASSEFKKTQIKQMVSLQQEKNNWNFMFLGANMDAISEAGSLGIRAEASMTFNNDTAGLSKMYNSISEKILDYRTATLKDASSKLKFSDEERSMQQ